MCGLSLKKLHLEKTESQVSFFYLINFDKILGTTDPSFETLIFSPDFCLHIVFQVNKGITIYYHSFISIKQGLKFLDTLLRDQIPTPDIRTLRNADIAAGEIQTGDMGTPLTGPHSCNLYI